MRESRCETGEACTPSSLRSDFLDMFDVIILFFSVGA